MYCEHQTNFIPQFDGPGQELFEFTDGFNVNRTAGFTFNQEKQTEKIKKDTKINDYEVNINNSDQNATIKCSTGFYIQVARACFVTLDKTSIITRGKTAITIDDVTITKDQAGVESTRLFHFSFMSDLKSLGGVAVHLHHSTRTIQVQGSHYMPDASRAALWFVNNVILVRFKDQAKAKNFAIQNCNETFRKDAQTVNNHTKTSTEPNNSCHSCNLVFNTKSKPSLCEKCAKYFHKTNCLKDHVKTCHGVKSDISPGFSSLPVPPVLSVPTYTSNSSASVSPGTGPNFSGLRTTLTFVPESFSASTMPVGSIPALQSATKATVKKKQKPPFPTSEAETKVEFLQTELNAAQARIVQLDSSILDKDRRVAVLMARLKVLEDANNKDVFDKYFPSDNKQNQPGKVHASYPTCTACPTSLSCQQSACCRPQRYCCSSSCHPASSPHCPCHNRPLIHKNMQPGPSSNHVSSDPDLKNTLMKELIDKIKETCIHTEELKTLIKDNFNHSNDQIRVDTTKDVDTTINIDTTIDVDTTTKDDVNNMANNSEEPLQSTSSETNESALNVSIASVEETIPYLPEPQAFQQVLNLHLPTNQLL